ncbi:tRNA (guanine(37)-N(1))-methyltransferase [Ranunculus cassubicifolius]
MSTTKFFLNTTIFGFFPNKGFSLKPLGITKKIQFSRLFCALTLDQYGYGPSLRKGRKPFDSQNLLMEPVDDNVIDKETFTRVFEVLAIRVPAEDCFALESQLRGHLLNWPRIRNIARVPGDEMEVEFKKILPGDTLEEDGDGKFDSLNRRLYGRAEGDGVGISPVLYRDNLVKSFNTRGFVKFRNLAKISRPKKKGKLVIEGDTVGAGKRTGKNDVYVVEEVRNREDEDDDMSGLLGEEFGNGKWRGSTRLLLLDEQFATKEVDELPEAIKALFKEGTKKSRICDLVMCRLTLFYSYWQMNEILEGLLPKGMIVPTTFEMVGHIAHLNLRDEHLPYKKIISQVVLDKNNPKIKTVVNKIDSIQNDYRTMQLEVLAGNHSLVTTVVENGFRFHVDLAAVYWNSRLATERQRLVNRFTSSDVVCDVFSGVGPLAIAAAKKVKHVYANDLNPSAVEYLEKNSVFNKLEKKITIFNMDGRRFIESMLTSKKIFTITQVVMNLPKDAAEFLDVFRGVLVKRGKLIGTPMPMIHVYGFSKAQDPEFDFHQRIKTALLEFAVEVEMHRVRLVAPGKWMLCASFVLPESVAFAK